jgi:hypothetical protein
MLKDPRSLTDGVLFVLVMVKQFGWMRTSGMASQMRVRLSTTRLYVHRATSRSECWKFMALSVHKSH